jgi:hypothetical protein
VFFVFFVGRKSKQEEKIINVVAVGWIMPQRKADAAYSDQHYK